MGGNFYADLVQTTSSSAQSARKKMQMIAGRKRDGGWVLQGFLVLLIAVGQCSTEKIILRRGETAKGDAITHACVSHRQQSVVTIMLHVNQITIFLIARSAGRCRIAEYLAGFGTRRVKTLPGAPKVLPHSSQNSSRSTIWDAP